MSASAPACDGAVVGRRARRHIAVLLRDHRVREHAGDLVGLVNSSNVVPEKDGKEKDPEKEDPEEEERIKDKRERVRVRERRGLLDINCR